MDLKMCRLFSGINEDEYCRMYECFRAVGRSFKAGERAFSFDGDKTVGLIERGRAELVRIDIDGERVCLERFGEGGVFGAVIGFGEGGDGFFVECLTDCDIVFIAYDQLTKRCEKACFHHTKVVENLLTLISERAVRLSERIEILTHRTIREKLLAFIARECEKRGTNSFVSDMSKTELAEYLGADRSAVSRELGRMESDGLIAVKGRKYALKDTSEYRRARREDEM